jgi:SAM-dependent methyltransferase
MRQALQRTFGRLGIEIRRPPFVEVAYAWGYMAGRRIPWSPGYGSFKKRFTARVLADPSRLAPFRTRAALPPGYGVALDERCVEWPWFFARASTSAAQYLDAGATLNHDHVIRQPFWRGKHLTILSLAPEADCFWRQGVSYQFGDLRAMPFRDGWFDEVACLSTLEHVGMDNSFYSEAPDHRRQDTGDFEQALGELHRVLKPGGRLLLTVPFGKYQNWQFFQQFDADLLERAARVFQAVRRDDTFYRYSASGWQGASRDECADCGFSEYMLSRWIPNFPPRRIDPDRASAARAVACCVWQRA